MDSGQLTIDNWEWKMEDGELSAASPKIRTPSKRMM